MDPERGALIYRKTTQMATVQPDKDSEFTIKKVKKVTSESTWLGHGKEPEPPPSGQAQARELLTALQDPEAKPWHDEEVETNPLYTSDDYLSDFNNPLYSSRQSGNFDGQRFILDDKHTAAAAEAESSDVTPLVPLGRDEEVDPSTKQGLEMADTLF